MSKTYWMIEKVIDGRAHWWIPDPEKNTHWNDPCRWTTEASEARHFSTKKDADYVIGNDMSVAIDPIAEIMHDCSATEHIDIE